MKNKKGATLVGSLVAIFILVTTFVSLLNLQSSIIKARFFMKNDNNANLLVVEGLEIVRAVYESKSDIVSGKYSLDYTNTILPNTSNTDCTQTSFNDSCSLSLNSNLGYKLGTSGVIFYRFVDIFVEGDITTAESTVIVKNPRGSNRIYRATTKFYKIN
jgi:hypothetical protein